MRLWVLYYITTNFNASPSSWSRTNGAKNDNGFTDRTLLRVYRRVGPARFALAPSPSQGRVLLHYDPHIPDRAIFLGGQSSNSLLVSLLSMGLRFHCPDGQGTRSQTSARGIQDPAAIVTIYPGKRRTNTSQEHIVRSRYTMWRISESN